MVATKYLLDVLLHLLWVLLFVVKRVHIRKVDVYQILILRQEFAEVMEVLFD